MPTDRGGPRRSHRSTDAITSAHCRNSPQVHGDPLSRANRRRMPVSPSARSPKRAGAHAALGPKLIARHDSRTESGAAPIEPTCARSTASISRLARGVAARNGAHRCGVVPARCPRARRSRHRPDPIVMLEADAWPASTRVTAAAATRELRCRRVATARQLRANDDVIDSIECCTPHGPPTQYPQRQRQRERTKCPSQSRPSSEGTGVMGHHHQECNRGVKPTTGMPQGLSDLDEGDIAGSVAQAAALIRKRGAPRRPT